MEDYPKQLMAKYPLNKIQVAGSTIPLILILLSIVVTPSKSSLNWSLSLIAIVILATSAVITLWWGLKKPHRVTFDKAKIHFGRTIVESETIEKMMINGTVVGIKLKGKKVVPPQLCVSFVDGTDGLQVLRIWAKHHHVKIVREPFMRWF